MRYRHLDLNLLIALDALLTESNVTRAAARLHLGQSATSAALGRLREHFNDPLLVPVGRYLEQTPLARQLAPKVRQMLTLASEVVDAAVVFDPAQCTRRFSVVASDYIAAVLLPAVSRELGRQAPGASLSARDLALPREGDVVSEALEYRRSDAVIVPQRRLNPRYPHIPLISDELCCLVCADAPAYAQGLTLADYCAAEHVLREFADGQERAMDALHLHELGIVRRAAVTLPSFALMPEFIVGTARIATLFRRQAQAMARRYPLRILPAPLSFPPAAQVLQWHPQQDLDPALAWLRGLFIEQAAWLDQP